LFEDEVERSSHLNQLLGIGIGLFQGLSNIALNGLFLSLPLPQSVGPNRIIIRRKDYMCCFT